MEIENYFSCFLKAQHDLHGVAQAKSRDYSRREAVWVYNNKIHFFEKREDCLAGRSVYCKRTRFCSISNRSLQTVMKRTLLLFIAWSYWSICLSPNSRTDNFSSSFCLSLFYYYSIFRWEFWPVAKSEAYQLLRKSSAAGNWAVQNCHFRVKYCWINRPAERTESNNSCFRE